jgi:hypothetical protein
LNEIAHLGLLLRYESVRRSHSHFQESGSDVSTKRSNNHLADSPSFCAWTDSNDSRFFHSLTAVQEKSIMSVSANGAQGAIFGDQFVLTDVVVHK